MNKKTRGGKPKLVFEPKPPKNDKNTQIDEAIKKELHHTTEHGNNMNQNDSNIYKNVEKLIKNSSNNNLNNSLKRTGNDVNENKIALLKTPKRVYTDNSLTISRQICDKTDEKDEFNKYIDGFDNMNSNAAQDISKTDKSPNSNISTFFNHSNFLLQLPFLPTENMSIQPFMTEWTVINKNEYKKIEWGAVQYIDD